jgi:TRAP-type C4-dicarboxylate transport system permease large subunit
MVLVGAILAIVGMSLASTDYLIDIEVPQRLFGVISSYVESPTAFMVALLVFLLILGAILDIFSAIVLVVPLILPVALQYGIDPIHLGIVFLAAMELGYLTPPVGLNLFISSFRFDRDITEVYAATVPFLLVLLICVIIITFIPEISLFLLSRESGGIP